MIENRHLGSTETVIIYMGANDLRTKRNIGFVLGKVYALMAKGKRKF